MSSNSAHPVVETNESFHVETFPWKHIIGFILSLILTGATLWLALGHHMSGGALTFTIIFLAVIQIAIQLFMFMHLTETDGSRAHMWTILLGFFFTFIVVAGSIWIMTFGSQVS